MTQIPHSREAEEATIGAVLINPEIVIDLEFLQPLDFYLHRNSWIWEAIITLHEKRKVIDLLTICEEMDKKGRLSEAGGSAYLTALVGQVPSSLNAEAYGRIVESRSVRRKMIEAANKIAGNAYDESKEIDDSTNEMLKLTEGIVRIQVSDVESAGSIISREYDRIDESAQKIARNEEVDNGIKTGFTDLDSLFIGWQKGDFIIDAGRPGMGKTGLMLNIALHVASKQKKSVAIFELEMSKQQLIQRLVSQITGIDSQRLRTGHLFEQEWPLFTHAVELIDSIDLYIDDTPSITPEQMLKKSRVIKNRYGLDLIVCDYLQLMGTGGRKFSENRTQEVSYISRHLKLLAREMNVPLLAGAQLSRAVEQRTDKRPMLSDLRESGSLEQDADIVMFNHFADQYNKESKKQDVAEIIVAKHRNGPTGSAELLFRKAFTRFENCTSKLFVPNEERAYRAMTASVGSED
jgi:replicative DNA helicase